MSYINAYVWNLEKGYGWSYLQSRNKDMENKHIDTQEERGGGINLEIGIGI